VCEKICCTRLKKSFLINAMPTPSTPTQRTVFGEKVNSVPQQASLTFSIACGRNGHRPSTPVVFWPGPWWLDGAAKRSRESGQSFLPPDTFSRPKTSCVPPHCQSRRVIFHFSFVSFPFVPAHSSLCQAQTHTMDLDESQRHRLVQSAFHALDHNKDGSINARDLLNVYADTFPSPEPGHVVLDEVKTSSPPSAHLARSTWLLPPPVIALIAVSQNRRPKENKKSQRAHFNLRAIRVEISFVHQGSMDWPSSDDP